MLWTDTLVSRSARFSPLQRLVLGGRIRTDRRAAISAVRGGAFRNIGVGTFIAVNFVTMNLPPAEDPRSAPPSSRRTFVPQGPLPRKTSGGGPTTPEPRGAEEIVGRPFSALQSLVKAEATGELISALDGEEVHVFLQAGKIVWATSTHAIRDFRHHLLQECGISKAVMAGVLAESQRTKRPLADTLLAAGLAGKEALRAAYFAQMAEPVFALRIAKTGENVFLRRRTAFNHADPSLTFALTDLVPSDHTQSIRLLSMLQRLRDQLSDHAYAVALRNGTIVAHDGPSGSGERAIKVAAFMDSSTNLMAVRRGNTSLLGVQLAKPGESIWCCCSQNGSFTRALRALSSFSNAPPSPEEQPHASSAIAESGTAKRDVQTCRNIVRDLADVRSVVLIEGSDHWLFTNETIEPSVIANIAKIRSGSLKQNPNDLGVQTEDAIGETVRTSALFVERDTLWFGTDLGNDASIWLILRRKADFSIGWGLLAALSRHVA